MRVFAVTGRFVITFWDLDFAMRGGVYEINITTVIGVVVGP